MSEVIVSSWSNGYEKLITGLENSLKANSPKHKLIKIYIDKNKVTVPHNQQPFIMLEYLAKYDKVLWLDADILVKKPLDSLFAINDFAVLYRPSGTSDFKFNSGVVLLNKKPEIIDMAKTWTKMVTKKNVFMADQRYLWKAYKKHSNFVKLVNIGLEYNDHHFTPDTTIWHAKGHCRKDIIWINELEKYSKGIA